MSDEARPRKPEGDVAPILRILRKFPTPYVGGPRGREDPIVKAKNLRDVFRMAAAADDSKPGRRTLRLLRRRRRLRAVGFRGPSAGCAIAFGSVIPLHTRGLGHRPERESFGIQVQTVMLDGFLSEGSLTRRTGASVRIRADREESQQG